jgi:hypothetical protein
MREIKFRAWDGHKMYEPCVWMGKEYVPIRDSFIDTDLMQFTGLHDIYVGDILSYKWKCEVYQNDEGTFMVKFHTNPNSNKPMTLKKYLNGRVLAGCPEDNKVIGNIYENPELL